ncbi:hypothetical protein IAT38_005359 [Cryptococcus sp. DSM 104549]
MGFDSDNGEKARGDEQPSSLAPTTRPHHNSSADTCTLTEDTIVPITQHPSELTLNPPYSSAPEDDSKAFSDTPLPRPSRLPSTSLPPGCHWGPALTPELRASLRLPPPAEGDSSAEPEWVIWVDFPPNCPQNPFFFTNTRKFAITLVATLFTALSAMNVSAYSIGEESMCRDLGCSDVEVSAGIAVYSWGFGFTPMVLAPLSEEFGRRWTYLIAVIIYLLTYVMQALAPNVGTLMASRVLQGCSGSVGATLVGGTIADIFIPAQRGLPISIFSFMAVAGGGFGALIFAWVESNPKLEWRWIWWIQTMMVGALIPCIFFIMRETREPVLLRRRASKLRKERGLADGGRYTSRSEVGKVGFFDAMKTSCTRPITFLLYEPIVTFFAMWMGIAWGVLMTQLGGLPYIFRNVHGFTTNEIGLVYITLILGALVGFFANFVQDAVYRRRVEKHGIEARLYAPMVAGTTFALGCFFYGFTSVSSVHWIVPCFGIVIIMASILTIYQSGFVYLSECYGSYASSAMAGQSLLRNIFSGSFAFFTTTMYRALTPRWTIFTWGCVAALLAAVPFVAYYHGPVIRAHSKYSKILMKEEQERIEKEKAEVLEG